VNLVPHRFPCVCPLSLPFSRNDNVPVWLLLLKLERQVVKYFRVELRSVGKRRYCDEMEFRIRVPRLPTLSANVARYDAYVFTNQEFDTTHEIRLTCKYALTSRRRVGRVSPCRRGYDSSKSKPRGLHLRRGKKYQAILFDHDRNTVPSATHIARSCVRSHLFFTCA